MPKRNPRPGQPAPSPTPAADPELVLQVALECAGRGWPVFPVNPQTKAPAVKGWQALATRDPEVIRGWFGPGGRFAETVPGVPTGRPSGLVVVDFDVPSAAHPDARGEQTRREVGERHAEEGGWGPMAVARTASGGQHYYYRYPAEGSGDDADPAYRIGNRAGLYGDGCGVDVRGDGGFVVAPGLPGREWELPPDYTGDYGNTPWGQPPAWLLADLRRNEPGPTGKRPAGRSTLAQLLQSPPVGVGQRDDWLAAVAGQYAARDRHQDSYLAQVRMAAEKLKPPLEPKQVDKVADSIWKTEQAKKQRTTQAPSLALDEPTAADAAAAIADGRAGYLAPARGQDGQRLGILLHRVQVKAGETTEVVWREWGDFDLEATGMLQGDRLRTYELRLHTARKTATGEGPTEVQLDSATLSDRRKLNAWLAVHGATINQDRRAADPMDATVRLQRYLDAQDPPRYRVVPHLGWHPDLQIPGVDRRGGFVTFDGVITADGLHTGPGVRPDPALTEHVRWRYGCDRPWEEVRQVLREVLTYHDQTVASVFGAWWAASLLKHAAMEASGMFPFMAIEAPSESGKTIGMFKLLVQLAGNPYQRVDTRASFRDSLGTNRNGMVWQDDLNSIENLEEIIRAATSEGGFAKKGHDQRTTVEVRLVAPFVISGENLGFGQEKALADRSIRLQVPNPKGRRSLRAGAPADRLQYEDIMELRASYDDDLTVLAGTLVQQVLRHSDRMTKRIRALRGTDGGRVSGAMAVLQAGAELLATLTGDPHHVDVVGRWVDQHRDVGDENTLTLHVLPRLLSHLPVQEKVTRQHGRHTDLPIPYVWTGADPAGDRDPAGARYLWVHAGLVAEWWQFLRLNAREGSSRARNEATDPLTAQLETIREPGLPARRFYVDGRPPRPSFVALSRDIGARLWGASMPTDDPQQSL